ncbi:LysR family transcriptional regulator [Nonomuraea longicatena]|uniref:LysR family transcriptional regulator n=1 Tax=Nonomuraea longicatena TaxID=83682 RepID=A0ABP4BJ22_9ACTN
MSNSRFAHFPQPVVVDLDLAAIRAFVAVADERSFSEAAIRLDLSQQAVSKRIARLESDLGATLFFRTRAGAEPTEDGRVLLMHARALLGLAEQAVAALRDRRRALRVDVHDTRLYALDLVRAFRERTPEAEVDVTTSDGLAATRAALAEGRVDAAFNRLSGPLDEPLRAAPASLEPLHLLVGRDHPLGGRKTVEPARLAGTSVWMPGNVPGGEWTEFYELLAAAFGFAIDASGPNFGYEDLVEEVALGRRVTCVGAQTRMPWHRDVVRIPLVDPVPVYPLWLLWHHQNRHPALDRLIGHVSERLRPYDPERQWLPEPDRAAFTARP